MSQHKATEERRYRLELAFVIGVGLALAAAAVIAILSISPSSGNDLEEFGGQSATLD